MTPRTLLPGGKEMLLASCGVVTAAASDDSKMDEPEDRAPAAAVGLLTGTQQGLGEVLRNERLLSSRG